MHGQCLCGAVRIQTTTVTTLNVCHCGMCRRWGSGAFVSTESTQVDITGKDLIQHYASSTWASRSFCQQCGTHLYYQLNADQHTYYLNAQLFDLELPIEVAQEIYTDHKPAYYPFFSIQSKKMTQQDVESLFAGGD
ncbi:Uncharacterized conserved protein [Acinetobacter marinus]|uniref:Uncharacterized conserved protein n=1 Tax=Acinetobacter marinus TaxID=281375 RepID=A0A1G6GK24_9GAMM|nr:GFA family protein [Acinetobacter marinus]SDB82351.1 Uncharacterized conserved protein [Acinetobacter marinus]